MISSLEAIIVLAIRIQIHTSIIFVCYSEIYPVAKPIQPQLIIEVIVRALSVSSGVKQAQDLTKSIEVKIQALRTLNALMAW